MTVRIAKSEDFPEVWRLFLLAYEENAILPLCEKKAAWFLRRALEPEKIPESDIGTRGVIAVIGPTGALQAGVFLTVSCFWYTEHHHIEEYVLLVDPAHRRSDHAKTLVIWMKEQVKNTHLPLITGILSNHRTEAKCRLYGRLLPKAGEFFVVKPESDTISPLEQTVNG
jgi:GNAT superfamily N-acetyltransferase